MKILIIEDEKIMAESLKTGLEDEGFAVDFFDNGLEGYEFALVEEADVIILDVMLPGMDGMSVCRKLRENKIYTPIVMLTARDTVADKIVGLDSGADDYVVKPFSFEELLARIRSAIRRTGARQSVLQIDTLTLNPGTHVVARDNREIELTGKEYAMLEYFMMHPRQVLTREQIVSHVWDYNSEIMSNVVEVMIKRLRQKIDRDFPAQKSLFKTVRGLGYRIG